MLPALTTPLMQQPVPDAEWHAARVQLEQALRREPDNSEVLVHLGVLCARAQEYRKARTILEKAVAVAPEGMLARRLLVELLICFGDLDRARGWVTTGTTHRTGDPAWRAALTGGLVAAIAGTLSNDSGPVLLLFGAAALAVVTAYVRGDPRLAEPTPEPESGPIGGTVARTEPIGAGS